MPKAKRKSYDDKFRASAVVMLQAQGYPDTKGALTQVAAHLKVPARTLSRWFNGEQNPPPDQTVNEKRRELKDLLNDELNAIFATMPSARADASYRDLGTVAGILFDKKQLIEGKPTSIVDDASLTDETRANRITELLDRGRARRDGRADRAEFVQ